MEIEVRLFAMLRERAGRDRFELRLADGATVRDALDAVGAEHDLGELIARMPVVAAVNREYVSDDRGADGRGGGARSPGADAARVGASSPV